MPAWSVPGTHSAGRPCILAWRTIISWSVTNIACPICSLPVTFGGGIGIVKGDADSPSTAAHASGWKHPPLSHSLYISASLSFGSKFLGSELMYSIALLRHLFAKPLEEPGRRLARGAVLRMPAERGTAEPAPPPPTALHDADAVDIVRAVCMPALLVDDNELMQPWLEYPHHPRTTIDR